MISYLIGKPLLQVDKLIVLVNGVGYGVIAPTAVLAKASTVEEVSLHIYTHVREDAIELYGFNEIQEKELFLLLLSVSGVGPKTAINIVDIGAEKIIHAVQTAEVSVFAAVPRVGKKLAQKIIIELKSKLGSLQELSLGPRNPQEQEIVDALVALGFVEDHAEKAVQGLDFSGTYETSQLLKQAIKLLSQKK
ncbi:MAG TPA: Holliday junction branch migration protein RuvA [Vitreimonas sp.]|nr:Holliday junction branch migration protein RuvA [Vitreimonas sp.]